MEYMVLARKWRPQRFEDIVGQEAIAKTLANAIRLKRVGHAFLFTGPRGIGKTSTARILSKALNCEKGPTPKPCNTCRFCREITRGSSMDVLEIDGASNRGIDEIRDLRESIRYAPASARFKIVIIDEVHMLTREAFNALLKTLEEPPPHAKFILATTEVHKVPITIVSRCQRFDFRRIDLSEIHSALARICKEEHVAIEDRTLAVIARMADGSLRDGLSLMDQVISFSGNDVDHEQVLRLFGRIDPDVIGDVFAALIDGDAARALKRFGAYMDSGGSEAVFNKELMNYARDVMAVKVGGKPFNDVPEDVVKRSAVDQLERMFHVLLELESSFRSTEFPRMMMDVALIKMSRIRALTPIETLMSRLDEYMKTPHHTSGSSPPRNSSNTLTKIHPKSHSSKTSKMKSTIHSPSPVSNVLKSIIDAVPPQYKEIRAGLSYGSLIQKEKNTVTIAFKPEHQFQKPFLEEPSRMNIVRKAVETAIKPGVRVSLIVADHNIPPSLIETERSRKKKEAKDKHELAISQPVITKLVDEFEGRIREIRMKNEGMSKGEQI